MPYVSTVLADAPLNYWRCADPGGGYLFDIGSAPKALVAGGAVVLPYLGPNSDGGSGWFNSANQAVYRTNYTVTSPFTLEGMVWVAFYAAALQVFLSVNNLANLFIDATHHVGGAYIAANIVDSVQLPDQSWHHVALTYGPTGGARLYKDGVLAATGAYAGAQTTTGVVSIGAASNATAAAAASVSECAIFGTELSAARISAHFLAIDAATSRPIFRGFGTVPSSTGGTSTVPELSSEILASVRKTY